MTTNLKKDVIKPTQPRQSKRQAKQETKENAALKKVTQAKPCKSPVQDLEAAGPKKRGRKLTEPNKYFDDSQAKIDEWRATIA